MAKEVRLAFIWHMHQPDYRDAINGMHLLPWVQLHGSRGYTDVAKISELYPSFKQTINFSPILLDQIVHLVSHPEADYFSELALKPVDDYSEGDRDFFLRHCFLINWDVHIKPNQRYYQLLMKRGLDLTELDFQYVRMHFTRSDLRDLVVLFHLAWSGFTLRKDPEIRALILKGQDYSEDDKRLVIEKQRASLGNVIELHKKLLVDGKIELSCTPYYHPILPLIIDTQVRPDHDPQTPEFNYPEDARMHIEYGLDEFERIMGHRPVGMWPAEGSVSQAAVEMIQDSGIRWIAADEALLYDRSTGTEVPENATNIRPWLIGNPGKIALSAIFRHRGLSDDIGFKFAKADPAEAVGDFVGNLERIAQSQESNGPPALVGIVCDGENPWEHYRDGGEGFLSGLARKLEDHKTVRLTTPTEYLEQYPAENRIYHIGAGSWISGNFDIWIGCDEDRRAWKILAEARRQLDELYPPDSTEENILSKREKILHHLLVAEGSDWFWWYGEPYHSQLDYLFDILFRRRIRRAYELMGLETPTKVIVPVDPRLPIDTVNMEAPLDVIHPVIDGRITNFYEWAGSGHIKNDSFRGFVAQENPFLIKDLYFNADLENLYLRLDINRDDLEPNDALVVRILRPSEMNVTMDLGQNPVVRPRIYHYTTTECHISIETSATASVGDIVEISIPVTSIDAGPLVTISLACFIMRGSERIERCPVVGTVSVTVPDEKYMARLWREY